MVQVVPERFAPPLVAANVCPNFESLRSRTHLCVTGCLECVDNGDQSIYGRASREHVSKNLLDALRRLVVSLSRRPSWKFLPGRRWSSAAGELCTAGDRSSGTPVTAMVDDEGGKRQVLLTQILSTVSPDLSISGGPLLTAVTPGPAGMSAFPSSRATETRDRYREHDGCLPGARLHRGAADGARPTSNRWLTCGSARRLAVAIRCPSLPWNLRRVVSLSSPWHRTDGSRFDRQLCEHMDPEWRSGLDPCTSFDPSDWPRKSAAHYNELELDLLRKCIDGGAEVLIGRGFHDKFLVVPDVVISGSANVTYSGLYLNRERLSLHNQSSAPHDYATARAVCENQIATARAAGRCAPPHNPAGLADARSLSEIRRCYSASWT